ncbi:cytochrome P450 [Acephala macrosclerotiorum]|nr:cytochrome P450 [Acephala macrosclerotiorum]
MERSVVAFQYAGNTFGWTVLGSRVWGTQDPENIRAMLSTKEKSFSHEVRREVLCSLIGDAIFTQNGASWRRSRALLKPLVPEHADNLIARIGCESTVDLQPLFFALTLDVTTAFIFGKSVYSLTPGQTQEEAEFSRAFKYAQVYLYKRYHLGRLCWLFNGKEFHDSYKTVHAYVDKIVDNVMQEKAKSTLNPSYNQVQLGVREEISTTFGTEAVEVNKTKDMPYLICALKEVLRLYPSVPVNSRTVAEDVVLPISSGEDGRSPVLVRKGEDVAVCVYSLHRRTDLYGSDADVFRPSR